jgi:hypoxanthine-guanine phosphoribosyltransferase
LLAENERFGIFKFLVLLVKFSRCFDGNFPRVACVGEVISEAYVLEYGTDCLEMHVGAVQPRERALVIDDLVATGGTLSAAIRLLGEF